VRCRFGTPGFGSVSLTSPSRILAPNIDALVDTCTIIVETAANDATPVHVTRLMMLRDVQVSRVANAGWGEMPPACVPLRGTCRCVCDEILRIRELAPGRESGGEAEVDRARRT
jgi:hypothetical protein